MNKNIIGLTGGIGCGKSTAAKIFRSLNCEILDADSICHELYNDPDGPVTKAIAERWGTKVFRSNLADRKKIADLVFNDKKELLWLNSILHPLIFEKAYEISEHVIDKELIIFDVPLLFEVKWEKYFSHIITIWSPKEIQLERLRQRNWSDKEIKARIASQISADEKLERADFGIINNGSLDLLIKQCKYIMIELKR